MEKKNFYVGVDIGTSNITMVVGVLQENNFLDIVASSIQESKLGVIDGRIHNIEIVGSAIMAAKRELEESMNIKISEAYVGVSNEKIRCATISDFVEVRDRKNRCITEEDIRVLTQRIENIRCEPSSKETVLQRIPICYTIDGKHESQNPVGEIGSWISATYLAIISETEQNRRLSLAFQKAHVTMKKTFVNPVVQPHLLLSKDEWNDGAAIVDIGGGTTDVSIVYKNKLRHIASLPIGGNIIDEDIASIGISKRYVNSIKRNHAVAMRDSVGTNDVFKIRKISSHKEEQFALYNLAAIIEARLCDIAEFVLEELHYSRLANSIKAGVILTGGLANIRDIDKLFARELKMPVRVVKEYYGLTKQSESVIGSSSETAAVAVACYSKTPCIVREMMMDSRPPIRVTPQHIEHTATVPPPVTQKPEIHNEEEVTTTIEVKEPTTETSEVVTDKKPTTTVTSEPPKSKDKKEKKSRGKGDGIFRSFVNKVLGYSENNNDLL